MPILYKSTYLVCITGFLGKFLGAELDGYTCSDFHPLLYHQPDRPLPRFILYKNFGTQVSE
jgi:hypothetical protein